MLAWLIAGHLTGDFLLQNKWMAENKTKNFAALLLHSSIYTVVIWLFSLPENGLNLKIWNIVIIFFSHIILDNRKFVMWWCRYITRSEPVYYLAVMTDQSWHIFILALVCFIN